MHRKYLFLTVVLACPAFPQTAQQFEYELGANIGYGVYRDGSILSPEGSIEAGIRNRFAAGITLGVDFSKYVSGELNFLYHDGHPFLQGLGVKADIQGNSWALTSSLLFHFKDRTHKFRPFVTGGAGAKNYIIAGPEPFPQPIPQVASLVDNDVWKVAFVVGGGVKYRIHKRVLLRGEFLDYLTTFPRTQIVPAPHNTARGIFEQFTPLFGVSYVF
jgi:opacity protein-like surface antigen